MDAHSKNSQWAILAGARFALALCVVITHSGNFVQGRLFQIIGATGYPAVFGFLMISGYSIAFSISKNPNGYFLRRVKRIYPAYLFALFLCYVIYTCFTVKNLDHGTVPFDGWLVFIGNALMLQGTLTHFVWIDGALWSLSIEWWCYMFAMVLIRLPNKIAIGLALASFLSYFVYSRIFGYEIGPNMPFGLNIIFLAWAWLTGFAYQRNQNNVNFIIMVILPIILFETYGHEQYASTVIALSGLAILFSKTTSIKSERLSKSINWLGAMSYPLYLVHYPLLFLIFTIASPKHSILVLAGILLSVSVGYYIACLIMKSASSAIFSSASRSTSATQ